MVIKTRNIIRIEKECPENVIIRDIRLKLGLFNANINIDVTEVEEAKTGLIIARTLIDSCILLEKSLFDLDENSYLNEYSEKLHKLEQSMGIYDAILDEIERDTIGRLESSQYITNQASAVHNLLSFQRELKVTAEHLVYYPIVRSFELYIKFLKNNRKDKEGNDWSAEIKKEIFVAYLFTEMLKTIGRLGNLNKIKQYKQTLSSLMPSRRSSQTSVEENETDENSQSYNIEEFFVNAPKESTNEEVYDLESN